MKTISLVLFVLLSLGQSNTFEVATVVFAQSRSNAASAKCTLACQSTRALSIDMPMCTLPPAAI